MAIPPVSVFEHRLDFVKGWDVDPARNLTKSANISSNVTVHILPGAIVSLNSVGEWETGVAGVKMPYIARPQSLPIGASATVAPHWQGMTRRPLEAVPCIYPVEVQVTHFDTAKTYAINNLLTGTVANSTQATAGLITNTNASNAALTPPRTGGGTTRTIVGQVTSPVVTKDGYPVLAFHTVYFPGAT
jgi:hypothetical protein